MLTTALSGTVAAAPATTTTGPAGPAPAGKIELVTCQKLTRSVRVHGHTRHVTQEKCTGKLVSGPVNFTVSASAAATLSRSDIVYASGGVSGSRLVLGARRRILPGRYLLTERRGATTIRQRVTIS